jgi:hydroxymethylglutaryl-CoA reductase (NADPH)
MLDHLRSNFTPEQIAGRLAPRHDRPKFPPLRAAQKTDRASLTALWDQISQQSPLAPGDRQKIADAETLDDAELYGSNIENMIGTVKVPVGVIGPLRVNGVNASGDYLVPLATTEAALVASYGRGAAIITRAGGASAAVLAEGVLRSPGYRFPSLLEAGMFIEWVTRSSEDMKTAAESTTRHGKLISIEPVMDNDIVFLLCRYATADASGQNMVTIATEAMCKYVEANCPVKPLHWFIEANFSGDKKSSYLGLLTGRGRKVTASVVLPGELVQHGLHVSVERVMDYARMANLGALLSGQFGAQGHYANGLAALYIATGQDAACVSESSVGFTRMEQRGKDLFVSVTLPNILVGTVGGGTGLPSQSAGLRLLGLQGDGHANALAEVVAVVCMCGEISIIGAIAAGHFTRAHHDLARKR